jgi:hypothetical protein
VKIEFLRIALQLFAFNVEKLALNHFVRAADRILRILNKFMYLGKYLRDL